MAYSVSLLWKAPEVNPISRKARSIPFLNPINEYGRVFFFSWFGFLIAFWSWYAFPPLLADVIAKDLKMSQHMVSNSNIIALTATLLVRLVAGPLCDRFGPRYTFAGVLLVGAIPTFLAGTAYTPAELYALRFFIGILGGAFVPCQVWTTGFYDKNIIGTANSITAGLGNAGGGITYFAMPAIYNSLRRNGLTTHVAWRVSFVVPGILIVTAALGLLLTCPDTPNGKFSDRFQAAENNLRRHSVGGGAVVDIPGAVNDRTEKDADSGSGNIVDEEKKLEQKRGAFTEHEARMTDQEMLDTAHGEVIQKPSLKEIAAVMFSLPTLAVGAAYFCSFGAELAINSILGNYYRLHYKLTLQESGNWAAMFGLMNVVFRPLGGVVSDVVYKLTGHSLWAKKILLHSYGVITGCFLLAIGLTNPDKLATMVCLVGIGLAFFLEGANGLNFSLVPHVHPYANGVVSGFTGACGNFGGIIFAIIFRYVGTTPAAYAKSIWIIGVITIAVNIAFSWIRPIPKGQVGGH